MLTTNIPRYNLKSWLQLGLEYCYVPNTVIYNKAYISHEQIITNKYNSICKVPAQFFYTKFFVEMCKFNFLENSNTGISLGLLICYCQLMTTCGQADKSINECFYPDKRSYYYFMYW